MPHQKYKSVSVNSELIERVNKIIKQTGTYNSVAEYISEATRLRVETHEKTIKTQGDNSEVVDEKQAKMRKNS